MQAYRDYLDALQYKLQWWSTDAPPQSRRKDDLPPILASVLELVEKPPSLIAGANNLFDEALANPARNAELMGSIIKLGTSSDNRASLALDLLAAHLWSSQVTNEGSRLPWLKLPNEGVAHVALDAEALHARGAAKDYWQRMLAMNGPLAIDWGRLIEGKDVPLSPATLSKTIPSMRKVRQGSPQALENDARQKLSDAAALSKSNAVDRALVPLSCGPLSAAEFVQSISDVLVVWRTPDEEFAVFSVDTDRGTWSTLDLWSLAQEVPKSAMARFESSAKLLIAETIHDLRQVGDSGLLDPSQWQAAPLEMELSRLDPKSDIRKDYRIKIWVLAGVRPSDVYVYMKARFGNPNGMMSALRRPGSDNLFHWQFNVSVGEDLLAVMASNARVECRASTKMPFTLADQHLIAARLKEDFRNHGAAMKEVRDELESWTLFANPYAQLTHTILEAESKLVETPVRPPPAAPFIFGSKEEADRVMQRRVRWLEGVRTAFRLSMTIRVMAPIWAEAFVNLVLLILRNTEVKSDDRLYGDLLRRNRPPGDVWTVS
jgi:hypothetical protein